MAVAVEGAGVDHNPIYLMSVGRASEKVFFSSTAGEVCVAERFPDRFFEKVYYLNTAITYYNMCYY